MINETLLRKFIVENDVKGMEQYSEDMLRYLEQCYIEGVEPENCLTGEIDGVIMYAVVCRICSRSNYDLSKYL